ncbi:MAG: enoyl-CoA hydratase [Planctomycetales bacterium 12-60-4]|nr:MAG: enoyl-CoA hydratase [Planctomycetales bacterium 12-60-4]
MTTATASQLLEELTGGVLRITLNRPERRNALSETLLDELEAALDRTAENTDVRCVVLAANGPVFSSGHDLGEMGGRTEGEYEVLFARCSRVMQKLRHLPQPVIARVHALATAAGCQLVAACDLAVASTEARFATPGVRIGLFCTTPMVPLVRSIPSKVAMEMLLTGQPISAQRAYEVGLVNRVVPAEQLDATIAELTAAIVASSPLVLRIGKQAFYHEQALAEPVAYKHAIEVMTHNAMRHDAQEGITAFLQKRPPQWTGE